MTAFMFLAGVAVSTGLLIMVAWGIYEVFDWLRFEYKYWRDQ